MKSNEEFLEEFLNALSGWRAIEVDEIPSIPLYVDQVTTFIGEGLAHARRSEEDKILTRTMINNYAANQLLPPPERKKYSRDHMLLLIFIYYFKNTLSIADIQTLLSPITERYFQKEKGLTLDEIYQEIMQLSREGAAHWETDIKNICQAAAGAFVGEENEALLQRFTFLSLLSYDVYLRKSLIEGMIDELKRELSPEKKDRPSKKRADV